MKITCPSCGEEFPIEAGFLDGDGKRLAAAFAEFEPALGRQVIQYLRLFSPPKTKLRLSRAVKIVESLKALVDADTVSADDRIGVRRAATSTMWARGIELMLADEQLVRGCRANPMANHNYLRKVVFGVAESHEAENERKRELDRARPARRAAEQPDPAIDARTQALNAKLAEILRAFNAGEIDQHEALRRRSEALLEGR
jgi:hypothetical protein